MNASQHGCSAEPIKKLSFCAPMRHVATLLLQRSSRREVIPLATAIRTQDRPRRSAASAASTIAATDGELLMRFVRLRDHGAYAEIVERHGRLVWMICQQVLRHHQDVEDAFQATFLILAQRARSIRASDSAAAWLYKVAMRTALAARRKRNTRREEPLAVEPAHSDAVMPIIDDREMLYVLLQEVRALPARYQTPLVMRYLEGQSRRAIAEQTDSTVGQIQGRLARGRRILRSRFLRRGVSLSLAAGAVASTTDAAKAAVSPSLVESTAATCFTNKISGSASGITPAALALAKEGVQAMWFALATKCTAIVTAVALTGGIVLAASKGSAGREANPAADTKAKIEINGANAAADNQKSASRAESNAQPSATTSYEQHRKLAQQLARRYDSAWSELAQRMAEKAVSSARLEIEQLEKAALQRKVEHLQNWLAELDAPPVDSSGDQLPEDKQKKRQKLVSVVANELRTAKEQFALQVEKTVAINTDLERAQIVLAQQQREIEEISRAKMQVELNAELSSVSTSDVAPRQAERGGKLAPGDVIRIQVANALADSPIADEYQIESMGTVALGPNYGRVKVAGSSILEAEEVIKKHLANIINDPVVQVTEPRSRTSFSLNPASTPTATYSFTPAPTGPLRSPSPGTTGVPQALQANAAKLQEMSAAVEQLRAENAKLKKELQQLSPKPIGQTR
jgi:RNA polymerase sigma factor (sigma-70 family)